MRHTDFGLPAATAIRGITPPPPGPPAATSQEARRAAVAALKLQRGDPCIETPLERVNVLQRFDHVLRKFRAGDDRYRYANRIRITLSDPDEIWVTRFINDEYRRRYVKFFDDDRNGFVLVEEKDGQALLTTFYPKDSSGLDRSIRRGVLLYRKDEGE